MHEAVVTLVLWGILSLLTWQFFALLLRASGRPRPQCSHGTFLLRGVRGLAAAHAWGQSHSAPTAGSAGDGGKLLVDLQSSGTGSCHDL